MLTAIEQILGHLDRRNTKASFPLVCKNADLKKTLSNIATTVTRHSNFKRELQGIGDTHVRYLFD